MTVYLLIPTDINESVPCNLEEIYHTTIVPKFGSRYATIWYWWQIACQIVSSTEPRLRKLLLWIGGLAGLKKLFDCIGLGGP